jgi:transglutaminase-like putative cysteine protease
LIVFTILLAVPLFFLLPRVGGAGFGGNPSGLATSSGFSDTVRLGVIGRIQQNDEVVMRVRLDGTADQNRNLYFRGVALDTFDNQSWSKSKTGAREPYVKGDADFIQIDRPANRDFLSIQTVYLEPLDTPVLFALPRAVGIQGNFPVLYKDAYGGLSYSRGYERMSYKVVSDRSVPPLWELRADAEPYTADVSNYKKLPLVTDQRIVDLATQVTAGANNRYDKARAVESYLQNNFGYTLEQKARGADPLADFLFNVREGHCEYFATAMAIMLRTQGIATRVVNGFHGGDYNDAADVTVIRQRNAHAWVEVYFPAAEAWVTFDPTPFSEGSETAAVGGLTGTVHKYFEALETFWIEYFVAYDDQGQRSLARSLRSGFLEYQNNIGSYAAAIENTIREWLSEVRGDNGFRASAEAIGVALACLAATVALVLSSFWAWRRLRIGGWFTKRSFTGKERTVVEFYERMLRVLASRGLTREASQTPLEFAAATGLPEAIGITEKYNRVRFGEKQLTADERSLVEGWLETLKAT